MLEIKRKKNEDIDRLVARFKRACESAGIRHEFKKREYYHKPSEIRNIENANLKFRKKKQKEREEKEKLKRKSTKRRGFAQSRKRKRRFDKKRVARRS